MRYLGLKVHELGCIRDVDLDLSTLPQIVAVCGPNGSGKTSLLQLLTSGSIWRECPTRGALSDLARARDSFVEVVVEHGQRYTIRQGVDAVSRKGETLILGIDGAPVVASGKIADAKAWVASHFPSREVLYASTVAIQGGGGNFLGLTAGERKAVILRALGIEAIERQAEQARERYRAAKAEHAALVARLGDERARCGDQDAARAQVSQAEQEAREATDAVEFARKELERAAAELAGVRRRNAEVEAARARVAELEQRVTSLLRDHAAIEERIANNQGLIAIAADIRDASERLPAIRAELQRVGLARAALERDIEADEERARGAEQDAARRRADADEVARKARAWEARATALPERREAAARLPERRAEVGALMQAQASARQAVDDQQAWLLTAADERIGGLRGELKTIAAGQGDLAHVAYTALRQDDAAGARVQEGPARLAELHGEHAAIAARLADAEQAMRRDADLSASLAEMEQALLEASAFAASAASLRVAGDESARRAEEIRGSLAAARPKLIELDAQHRALEAEAQSLEQRSKLLGKLEAAEARIAELRHQANALAAQARILRDTARAAEPAPGTEVLDEGPFARAHDTARHALPKAEERARAASAAVARAQTQLEAAEAAAGRLEALEASRARVEEQVADWSLLADSLGRDGLQAHLVDAAGPELTTLANDLLHRAFGHRFTVSITTTRPKADGRGEREVFDVGVLDVERGRDGGVEGLSGGERVIVGEAISLALAMLVARKHGIERPTLIRDESGAALDPENGRRWISMLRRAVELVGADRLLFVTHTQELAELADARLVVADGTVRVES